MVTINTTKLSLDTVKVSQRDLTQTEVVLSLCFVQQTPKPSFVYRAHGKVPR